LLGNEAGNSELQNRKGWSSSMQQPATYPYPEPNPIHTILHHLYMISFNIIPHSIPRSHKQPLKGFPIKMSCAFLMYAPAFTITHC